MNVTTIIDNINMKKFPEMITDYLRSNSIKKYNNLRSFYSRLLECISEDVKNSYLNRILKYLSADSESTINIIEDFNDGIYDNELMSFSKDLANIINSTDECFRLYEKINRNVNFVFYENEKEYVLIKESNNNQKYDQFLFHLLKHTFKKYKLNLPNMSAKRLLNEALTLNYNTIHRIRMIQASAELGNDLAINLYASYVYQTDKDAAIRILLTSKLPDSILWQVAFELENNTLNKETIQLIKFRVNDLLIEDDFINKISVTEKGNSRTNGKNLLFAFKIYYYIVENYGFAKAYNSIGKLMIFDFVTYNKERNKTIEIAKKYLKKAIDLGNVHSIANLSSYYYNNPDDVEFDRETIKKLFKVAASLGDNQANYYYGKILIDEGNYKEGFDYLIYASDRNFKQACFEVARYYEMENEIDKAIAAYKKAIVVGYVDAAYYLALLYLNGDMLKSNKTFSISMARDYLTTYMGRFTEKIKFKAKELLDSIDD